MEMISEATAHEFIQILGNSDTPEYLTPPMACVEVDAITRVFSDLGREDLREAWIEAHRDNDEECLGHGTKYPAMEESE